MKSFSLLSFRRSIALGLIAFGLAVFAPADHAYANGIEHFFAGEELGDADDRFQFETTFTNPTQPIAPGGPLPNNPDDGLFFFFDTDNAAVLAKILDQGGSPDAFRNFVFYGSQTSIGLDLTVVDTQSIRVQIKSGIIGPGGFRTTSRSSFSQGVRVRNTTDTPIPIGVNFSGSHHATGVYPVGPGSNTKHVFSVDVNDGSDGFFNFGTQGHANTFSPGFNGAFGNLLPTGVTPTDPGLWLFDEQMTDLTFSPIPGVLAPGEVADFTLTGLVENELVNNDDPLASYDGFNTTIFDFELAAGLEVVAFVPEPNTLAILGVLGLSVLRRRRG